MTAEKVAHLHYLSKDYGVRPHEYLGVVGEGEWALYWKWAIDDAARQCANYLEHQDHLKSSLPKGYMLVEPE